MSLVEYGGAGLLFVALWAVLFAGFGALLRWLWAFGRGDDAGHPPLRL